MTTPAPLSDRVLTAGALRISVIATVLVWVPYAILTLLAPTGPNKYSLSDAQLLVLQFTIMLPVLAIWFVAIYGAVRFQQYATAIRRSADGRALEQITRGLMLLVLSFIVQSFVGILPRFAAGTDLVYPLVFIENHVPMIISLLGLGLMYIGSRQLSVVSKSRVTTRQVILVLVPFALAAAVYAWYFYTHLTHVVMAGIPNFTVPGHWPFYTQALPYIVVWGLGTLTILNLANYIMKVKGRIYRASLVYLAVGIMAVVAFTAFLQLVTLSSQALVQLQLAPLLLFIYVLLLLYALGFVLIAMGARKLSRIEVV